MTDNPSRTPDARELDLLGSEVAGSVQAVFRWGVVVDLGLSRVGFIDPLYIDDADDYRVGQKVSALLTFYDENMDKFLLRPHGQVPIADRLRAHGHDA